MPSPPAPDRGRRRPVTGLVVGLALVMLAVVALTGCGSESDTSSARTPPAASAAATVLPAAQRVRRPMLLYRSVDHGARLALVPLATPDARPQLASMACDRLAYRSGRGLCVTRSRTSAEQSHVAIFGPDLRRRATITLEGIPSRARVSGDGRYGTVTMFVGGHAYAKAGAFSTATTLLDLRRGTTIANLEDFTVYRGQRQVTAEDVNFWGVTFARDSDRFYATLATGGQTYLIRGSIRERVARALHRNVECPSLSPDGRRIAYKKRVTEDGRWRLTVLDLKTMRETRLSETRSIDDQVEWLDDDHVLYGTGDAVWVARADGGGLTQRYVDRADSPAVVRW